MLRQLALSQFRAPEMIFGPTGLRALVGFSSHLLSGTETPLVFVVFSFTRR